MVVLGKMRLRMMRKGSGLEEMKRAGRVELTKYKRVLLISGVDNLGTLQLRGGREAQWRSSHSGRRMDITSPGRFHWH